MAAAKSIGILWHEHVRLVGANRHEGATSFSTEDGDINSSLIHAIEPEGTEGKQVTGRSDYIKQR